MSIPLRMTRFHLLLGITMLIAATSCMAAPAESARALNPDVPSYPDVDPALGEHLYSGEEATAEKIAATIEKSLRKQYSPGSARRDVHPKSHGCVQAEIRIEAALPDHLAKGMFIPGKNYQALIRFSNGSRDASRADIERDARGMAVKVLNVPGKKLLEDGDHASTQDFIMINHPVFFTNNPDRYLDLIRGQDSDSFFRKLLTPFALGSKGTFIALQTINKRISNPLQTRYWSMVPYQLGTGPDRQAVKYSARACSAASDPMPEKPDHDFLRDALRNTLHEGDACMELLVQPRTSKQMEVEDSMTEWKEADAPFYKVATMHIPRQSFDTPVQNEACENLSFNPWHALPAHKPLGAMNRLRKVIYDRISRVRHEMNSGAKPLATRDNTAALQ